MVRVTLADLAAVPLRVVPLLLRLLLLRLRLRLLRLRLRLLRPKRLWLARLLAMGSARA